MADTTTLTPRDAAGPDPAQKSVDETLGDVSARLVEVLQIAKLLAERRQADVDELDKALAATEPQSSKVAKGAYDRLVTRRQTRNDEKAASDGVRTVLTDLAADVERTRAAIRTRIAAADAANARMSALSAENKHLKLESEALQKKQKEQKAELEALVRGAAESAAGAASMQGALAAAKAESAAVGKTLDETRRDYSKQLEDARAAATKQLEETRAAAAKELEEQRVAAEKKLEEQRVAAEKKLAETTKNLEAASGQSAKVLEQKVDELTKTLAGKTAELQAIVDEKTKQNADLQRTVDEQRSDLDQLMKTTTEQAKEIGTLQKTMGDQSSSIRELERVLKVISGEGDAIPDDDAATLPPSGAPSFDSQPPVVAAAAATAPEPAKAEPAKADAAKKKEDDLVFVVPLQGEITERSVVRATHRLISLTSSSPETIRIAGVLTQDGWERVTVEDLVKLSHLEYGVVREKLEDLRKQGYIEMLQQVA